MINIEELDYYHHRHSRPILSTHSARASIRLPQVNPADFPSFRKSKNFARNRCNAPLAAQLIRDSIRIYQSSSRPPIARDVPQSSQFIRAPTNLSQGNITRKQWQQMTVPSAQSPSGAPWRGSERSYHQEHRSTERREIPDVVERNVSRWRNERQGFSRNPVFKSDDESSQQDEVVNGTLSALQRDVEETTEILRRKNEQWKIERRQFQTEMEVTGRMSIIENDDWLTTRLKAVSSEDMNRELGKIKDDQKQNAVTDTLAALVYDVNATAEVLRRGRDSMNREKAKKNKKQEIEYHLRLTPQPDFPPPRREQPPLEQFTVDEMNRDYGVEMTESQTDSAKRKRARSETPRRTLQIEGSPEPEPAIICAYCSEEIEGAILTALAPNSERAQKFHTYHFMCTYCQKALNMHGTYREHDRKPYCHDCFYKLYNGLRYEPDEHQAFIEKLI